AGRRDGSGVSNPGTVYGSSSAGGSGTGVIGWNRKHRVVPWASTRPSSSCTVTADSPSERPAWISVARATRVRLCTDAGRRKLIVISEVVRTLPAGRAVEMAAPRGAAARHAITPGVNP